MEAPRGSRLNSTGTSVSAVASSVPSSNAGGDHVEEGVSDVDLDMNLLLQVESSANNESVNDSIDRCMDD